jgi:hypothetical protein
MLWTITLKVLSSFTRFANSDYQINSIMKDKTITFLHKINTLHILIDKLFFFYHCKIKTDQI